MFLDTAVIRRKRTPTPEDANALLALQAVMAYGGPAVRSAPLL